MENIVIEVLNEEHGKQVLEYFKLLGINTEGFNGVCTLEKNHPNRFYGIVNNRFSNYTKDFLNSLNIEISSFPIVKEEYPKLMWVSNNPFKSLKDYNTQRIVFAHKCGKYVAWAAAETIEEAAKVTNTFPWSYAEEIKPILEVTLKEVADKFGVSKIRVIL